MVYFPQQVAFNEILEVDSLTSERADVIRPGINVSVVIACQRGKSERRCQWLCLTFYMDNPLLTAVSGSVVI